MPCSVDGCPKLGRGGRLTNGLCDMHYMRQLRTGRLDSARGWQNKSALHSKHPMYGGWQQMILRCHDPKNSIYPRYGARGITVCQRWRDDFQNFLADMGERPEGMTLDRIDPRGGYAPENCRWADSKTQRANITPEGDRRMREAMSRGVKARWERFREDQNVG